MTLISNPLEQSDLLLESTAKSLPSYAFLLRAWMRSADAKIISDGEKIIAVNDEASSIFGYHASELMGQLVDILLPDEAKGRHAEHRKGYQKHPKNRPMGIGMVLMAKRKDGTEFQVEVNLLHSTEVSGLFVEATIRLVNEG